ncbi:MAG: DUF2220 family protein [Elusimicrobiota bacterium]|nr:MAG: DUF2220 family protein [Elusimicrobiota bacterium]
MISPEDIRSRALKLWETQRIQRAHLEGLSLFPWELSIPRPTSKELADGFARLRASIQQLEKSAKTAAGSGYAIEYTQINHRRLGNQTFPRKVVVSGLDDYLHLTGKRRQHEKFSELAARILTERPELKPLLCRRPALVLDHADDWSRLLAVCRYFQNNPRPDLYMRQLDIPGVDTKFIETRRAIIADLLSAILPAEAVTATSRGLSDHGFGERFGLKVEPALVRFRMLDGDLTGATDLSMPLIELTRLSVRPKRVFITENKMNGLSFPNCRDSLVIFGLGYGASSLASVPWLREAQVYYWGDIDTHGFAILSQLREFFPDMRSFLMDERTLLAHRELWGQEEAAQRFTKDLERLTADELALFQALRSDRWGRNVRLEQERVGFRHVQLEIAKLGPAAAST